ncbi:MAG: NAD+ synthase [Candidatus Micrarchaeia archaeon]
MDAVTQKDIARIVAGISKFAKSAGKGGKYAKCVLGVSGGVDSAACLALCAKAVGPENIIAVFMPARFTPTDDGEDAKSLCKAFGVKLEEIGMEKPLEAASGAFGGAGLDKKAKGNILARLRMACLYAQANRHAGIVVGTGDKSEIEVGYFTKYGDGGCDFLPIANYYKTQVRQIALLLGVEAKIANKPSSPRLWEGHQATEEIGHDYEKIDLILELLEKGMEREAAGKFGAETVSKIKKLIAAGMHKRAMPPAI